MAIRTFNSVGGFSVGENPTTIILANGDITTGNATLTGNLEANNVLTDHLLYANGVPWDFQLPAGSNYWVQFNDDGSFGANANFTFDPTLSLLKVTGNANVTNTLFAGNISVPTGNITANRVDANIYGNVYANTVLTGTANGVTFNDGGVLTVASNLTYDKTSNALTLVGNITTTNANLGNLTISNYYQGTLTTAAQPNITSVGTMSNIAVAGTGSVTGANLVSANYLTGTLTTALQPNITQVGTLGALNVLGNISSGNANLGNLVTANYFSGTLITGAQPNITSVGTLSSLAIDQSGSVTGANLVSANYIAGTLTTGAQPNITSIGTLSSLTITGNLSSGNANLGNLGYANYLGGTLTTAAQPNITSVGNLASLVVTGNANVDGNLNAANLAVTSRVISSLIPSIDNNFDLGATGNKWKDLYISNINIGSTYIKSSANVILMDAANVANNASVGTLTSRGDASFQANVTIAGNLTVSGNTTYINVTNLDITDPLIGMGGSGNGANATSYDGKDRGMILYNYYSNGSGPVNEAFIWKTGNSEFQAISQINSITNEVVTASAYANIRAAAFLGNLDGKLLDGNQANITTVGTLGNLTISGNLRVNTTANLNALIASGLTYPVVDGSSSQVLSTYGNGSLYWATISTSSLANGNSNITVYQNGNTTISSNGVSNIVVVDGVSADSPQLIVNGNANITGTITSGNTNVANLLIGNATVRSATITTSSIAANQTIAAVSTTGVRGVIFDIKGEQASGGKYSIATVYCVHDGTGNVDYTVSGTVLLGGPTGTLAVNISLNQILLGVTPSSSNSTVWTTIYRTI